MKFNLIEALEILNIETATGKQLVINEQSKLGYKKDLSKYHASLDDVKIKNDYWTTPDCGYGNTMDEALSDLCKKLENKQIGLCGLTGAVEWVVVFPKLIHTKLLGK